MAPRENIDDTVAAVATPLRAPRSAAVHERSREAEAEFGISRERLQARLQRPSASISTGRGRRRRKQSVKRNEDAMRRMNPRLSTTTTAITVTRTTLPHLHMPRADPTIPTITNSHHHQRASSLNSLSTLNYLCIQLMLHRFHHTIQRIMQVNRHRLPITHTPTPREQVTITPTCNLHTSHPLNRLALPCLFA